jgi:Uma2 family endonuclease
MGDPALKRATYADLRAAPDNLRAELISGSLHTQPRPGATHAQATSTLGEELGPPFKRGKGGPGGWIILDEPELHFGTDVLVPDLAGWRRETMPELPDVAHFEVRPDWICEALSPSTRLHDRVRKMPVYAREGVPHVWLLEVDPAAQTLEVFRLDGETYRVVAAHGRDEGVRAEPFDAIELQLGALWQR